MSTFFKKHINDCVHGTIGLSDLEFAIISASVFQRLHNVKQLGLGSLIYPGANYSRFSHSVGACYVVGQLLEAIERNYDTEFDDHAKQNYRLAALLHDLGHYPLSHTVEHAINDYYSGASFLATDGDDDEGGQAGELPSYNHEIMGRRILEHDAEIQQVLSDHDYSIEDVKSIFSGEQPDPLRALISSDLDCDRLDYLLRTAHHAGLPYGEVDARYLITQATLDRDGLFCFTPKALRAADHLLVSRYFDYTQLPFHKTVVSLEIILEKIVEDLLERGILNCSSREMMEIINNGEWYKLDDAWLTSIFRKTHSELGDSAEDTLLRRNLNVVLFRQPPKLIVYNERITDRSDDAEREFRNNEHQLLSKIDEWAGNSGVDPNLWHVWSRSLALTKMGSKQVVTVSDGDEVSDEQAQLVRILDKSPNAEEGVSTPLISYDNALTRNLSDTMFYGIRLYINFSDFDGDVSEKCEQIREMIKTDWPHWPFM